MEKTIKIERFVGLDVGDRWSYVCVLDESGEVVERTRLSTCAEALTEYFSGAERWRVAFEVGVHSPWMSRLLETLGHEVIVAHARYVALIYKHARKQDAVDAEALARLARFDPELLHPIQHRSQTTQADLAILRSRDQVMRMRTQAINHVRQVVKSFGGESLPSCNADAFARRAEPLVPEALRPALAPLVEHIGRLSELIRRYDQELQALATQRYPQTEVLRQIPGVGLLSSLAYVLVLEDPHRFRSRRSVGAYLGLVPRLAQSGEHQPQLRITRRGDALLRKLLVNCAHYILGPFGPDCDLRRFGQRLAARGGPRAKKKAVVAVARKLTVLLHRLWTTGEVYDPHHARTRWGSAQAA